MKQFDAWHKTKQGYLYFGLAELLLAYIVGSFAINNGSLLFYGATLILLYGAISNFVKLMRVHQNKHDKKPRSKKTA